MQLSHVAQFRKAAHTLSDDPLLVRQVAKVLLPREPPELLTRLMHPRLGRDQVVLVR